MKFLLFLSAALLPALAQRSEALPPLSGRPVPELEWLDTSLGVFMDLHGIQSGVVGIMRNGTVIYLRGAGWLNLNTLTPLPETALFRLASCTKPITAAAIRHLIRSGSFDDDDLVFSPGTQSGLLGDAYRPWPQTGDSRIRDITVDQLLRHYGGWDRDVTDIDLTRLEEDIADDMDVASPPGRTNTMRWILGQPLEFTPGARYAYSNVGYLALGLLVTEYAPNGHMNYLHERVLTPDMWVPSTELVRARTFDADNDPREPRYQSDVATCVFDNGCEDFPPREAYGGVDMEARLGQGGLSASASAMLHLARNYHISPGTGQRIADVPFGGRESHNGALPGTNTLLVHTDETGDGDICIFIAFSRDASGEAHYASDFYAQIETALLHSSQSWPAARCDGFWVAPAGGVLPGHGSYTYPFASMSSAVAATTAGSRLRLKPGNGAFSGVLNKRLLLDAPLGVARLGIN